MAGCIFFLLLIVPSLQSSEVYIPCTPTPTGESCPVGYHCCGQFGCWKDGSGCPKAPGYKLHATSECRTLKIFADGSELASLGFGATDKSGVDVPGNTTTIQLQCIQPGPTGGILASADNGLKTDGTWTCSSDSGATWKTASFISRETYYPANHISDDAKVIWIHDFTNPEEFHSQDTIVFCKTDVANTTSEELIPCDNGICPPNSRCCENQCCPSQFNCGCWGCWIGGGLGPVCPVNAPSCPVLKTVGDICYERLEDNVDTSSYGCTANCTYKKIQNNGSVDERFCFAPGVFPVNNYKCQNLETDEPEEHCGGNCAKDYHCGPSCPDCILFGDSGRCANKSGEHCGGNCAKDYHCGPSCPDCILIGASGRCANKSGASKEKFTVQMTNLLWDDGAEINGKIVTTCGVKTFEDEQKNFARGFEGENCEVSLISANYKEEGKVNPCLEYTTKTKKTNFKVMWTGKPHDQFHCKVVLNE